MTQTQINALLLGLFGASGPVAKVLSSLFHLDAGVIHDILDALTALTPMISGGLFIYLQRPSGLVTSVAELPPAQQHDALTHVDDVTKVKIAEAVPGVATVVIKDEANSTLAALAKDETHPNVVTETQNEADAKNGTKVS